MILLYGCLKCTLLEDDKLPKCRNLQSALQSTHLKHTCRVHLQSCKDMMNETHMKESLKSYITPDTWSCMTTEGYLCYNVLVINLHLSPVGDAGHRSTTFLLPWK